MINSRNIADLNPKVKPLALNFVADCKSAGIDVIITSTYRDYESQNALYAQGRTTPGNKVTNAKGGQSFHNFRVAFDFVPIVNGKAQWNDIKSFNKCGQIAKLIGLEWAGDWIGSMRELAHCQLTNNLSLKDFQSGKTL